MVLGENEALTKDVLTEFLGNETGNIKDLSEEAQREMEQSKADNEQGEERAVFSVFGNASIYKSADETVLKEAERETVYMEAEKILSAKLSQIGMTEIDTPTSRPWSCRFASPHDRLACDP